jgi:hypothetical protein
MILGSYGSLLAASPLTMSAILLELRPFLGSFLLLSLTPFVLFGLSSRIALIRSSPARPARFYLLRRILCAVFFLAEIVRAARFPTMVVGCRLRRLVCLDLRLLGLFEAAFLTFLTTVLPFLTNFLPSCSAVRTKLLCDNASGNALALAAIVPNVLPIDSATLARIVSPWACLRWCDAICQLLFIIRVLNRTF